MATIFIRKNTPELRANINDLGFNICECAEFDGWDWLSFHTATNSDITVHGIPPHNSDPIKRVEEGDRGLFLHKLTDKDIDCGVDEDRFINLLASINSLASELMTFGQVVITYEMMEFLGYKRIEDE